MASNRNDFLLDANDDLQIKDGDFQTGASDKDHVIDIALTYKGEWKQYPQTGIGLESYRKLSNPAPKLKAEAFVQYQADGYKSDPQVSLDTSGNLKFNPRAELR